MKKTFLLFSILSIVGFSSCVKERRAPAPHNPQPIEYSFIEDFDDDRNGWSFADPVNYAYGVVTQGSFFFDYNDDYYDAYYAALDIDFNTRNDFTIQTRIGSSNTMGLLFGFNDLDGVYGYSFTVDYDGYFALYDEGGNGYGSDIVELIPYQTSNIVNYNGDWNDLAIEQRGNQWIGYINNYEVFRIESQRMLGNKVGFVVLGHTQGEADYLDAYWYR